MEKRACKSIVNVCSVISNLSSTKWWAWVPLMPPYCFKYLHILFCIASICSLYVTELRMLFVCYHQDALPRLTLFILKSHQHVLGPYHIPRQCSVFFCVRQRRSLSRWWPLVMWWRVPLGPLLPERSARTEGSNTQGRAIVQTAGKEP